MTARSSRRSNVLRDRASIFPAPVLVTSARHLSPAPREEDRREEAGKLSRRVPRPQATRSGEARRADVRENRFGHSGRVRDGAATRNKRLLPP
ncbi:hypothetical protein HPB50_013681 [Hyalomma asiaticum]|uniref:Uncharacterized protein n=1 Tax=Hyalomma asiaticum TaxID=266040 RepID=A0ACB7THB5_HYAAI|nr:hypothetical protein HPB50_013681 [Hyalomma asiaticum]